MVLPSISVLNPYLTLSAVRGPRTVYAADTDLAMHQAFRFMAACHVAGMIDGDDMLKLTAPGNCTSYELTALRTGRVQWLADRLLPLERALSVPDGYIAGTVRFDGSPYSPNLPLDLPPWLLVADGEIVMNTEVIQQPLRALASERRNELLLSWIVGWGLAGAMVAGYRFACGKIIFTRAQLAFIRYQLVEVEGLPADQVLPFVAYAKEGYPALKPKELVKPKESAKPKEPAKKSACIKTGVLSGFLLQNVADGRLPSDWQPALEQLQALADAGKLKIDGWGMLPRQPFVDIAANQMRRRGYHDHDMFACAIVEAFPALRALGIRQQRVFDNIATASKRKHGVRPEIVLACAQVLETSFTSLLGLKEA